MERYHFYCVNIAHFIIRVVNTLMFPLRYYIPNPIVIYGIFIFFALAFIETYFILNYDKIIGPLMLNLGPKTDYRLEYLNT